MTEIRWFYVAEGRRQGPVELGHLVDLIHSGTIQPDTLVWYAGRPDWVPAARIPEIAREIPPPLPGAAPAVIGGEPPGPVAFEIPAADGSASTVPPPGLGERPLERHHRHRHKRHRYVVIASPWWRRWMIPFILALVGLVVVLWLYLTHINSQRPPEVYEGPVGEVAGDGPLKA